MTQVSLLHSRIHGVRPPRLLHSPSLPNIHPRHSTPPASIPSTSADMPPSFDTNQDLSPSHKPTLDLLPPPITPQSANKSLRLFNNDHLLTPPLTPASSLRNPSIGTSTDSDSALGSTFDHDFQSATRFLLIEHVPRNTCVDILRDSILHVFQSSDDIDPHKDDAAALRVSASTIVLASYRRANLDDARHSERDSPIKGILDRLRPEQGVVFVAFHDVRDAHKVKGAIDASGTSPFPGLDDDQGDLACEFISAKQLEKLVGKSKFIDETDGTFFIAASAVEPKALCSVLTYYGPLREFTVIEDTDDSLEGDADRVFHVEYFDRRDSNDAYRSLSEKAVFGGRLTLYDQWPADVEQRLRECEGKEHPLATPDSPSTPTSKSTNFIPFPKAVRDQASGNDTESDDEGVNENVDGEKSHERVPFFDAVRRMRPRSVSAGNGDVLPSNATPLAVAGKSIRTVAKFFSSSPPSSPSSVPLAQAQTQLHDIHGRRSSNHLFFDATGSAQTRVKTRRLSFDVGVADDQGEAAETNETEPLPSPPYGHQHFRSAAQEPSSEAEVATFYTAYPTSYYPATYNFPPQPSQPASTLHFSLPPASPHPTLTPTGYAYDHYGFEHAMANAHVSALGREYHFPPVPNGNAMYYPPLPQPMFLPSAPFPPISQDRLRSDDGPNYVLAEYRPYHPQLHSQQPSRSRSPPPSASNAIYLPRQHRESPPRAPSVQSERNQLNIARIEDGLDTRTTVMIKNIPNKMSDKDLEKFIGKVCPRKIDFLYLRMDFQNGCNVGYAFVNFINVEDLVHFAVTMLGVKWNMYSSEKVLQMSYANYQGKEALVEKFKNSCIMDERDSWRPKIFYSDPGPNQGLPEPFPAPTHIRRKERSSYNRGALFVPGVHNNNGGSASGGMYHHHNHPHSLHTRRNQYNNADDRRRERGRGYDNNHPDRAPDRGGYTSAAAGGDTFQAKRTQLHRSAR